MSDSEWLACGDPDLLLEVVEESVRRHDLVVFVRRCWERITPYLPPVESSYTVVDEYAVLADQQSNHDAALYAAEAVLKAARWAPDFETERKHQAALLRQLISRPV